MLHSKRTAKKVPQKIRAELMQKKE